MQQHRDTADTDTAGTITSHVESSNLIPGRENQTSKTTYGQQCGMTLSTPEPAFVPIDYELRLLATHYLQAAYPAATLDDAGGQTITSLWSTSVRRFAIERFGTIARTLCAHDIRRVPTPSPKETSAWCSVDAFLLDVTCASSRSASDMPEVGRYMEWLSANLASYSVDRLVADDHSDDVVEGITLMPHELVLVAKSLYEQARTSEFESWLIDGMAMSRYMTLMSKGRYDEILSSASYREWFRVWNPGVSIGLAATGERLSKIRDHLGEDRYDNIVAPIEEKWKTRYNEARLNSQRCEYCGDSDLDVEFVFSACERCEGEAETIHLAECEPTTYALEPLRNLQNPRNTWPWNSRTQESGRGPFADLPGWNAGRRSARRSGGINE